MNLKQLKDIIFDIIVFLGLAIIQIIEATVNFLIPRRYREKSLKGEIALITGGASGIGRLIAIKLATLGAQIVIWDNNKNALDNTVQEIISSGGKCVGYHCDISDKKEVYRIAKMLKLEIGNVNLLINNAGYVYGRTLMELPDDEIERTYKINILSHYWTTKAFLKEMMRDNHGHIVTISSVAGLLGTYMCTDYSATKFAAVGFHESLFSELRTHGYDGIHTTLVCPYFINTGMFFGVKPRIMPMLNPEYVAQEIISGILTNQVNVMLPPCVRYFLPLKCLLPAKTCWTLMYHVLQGPQSMMMFRGRSLDNAA